MGQKTVIFRMNVCVCKTLSVTNETPNTNSFINKLLWSISQDTVNKEKTPVGWNVFKL